MEMDYATARLFGFDALGRCNGKDFIDWALGRLQRGATETGIAILAGLNPATTYFEAKETLLQALYEMDMEWPPPVKAMDTFVEVAARAIVSEETDFQDLLAFAHEACYRWSGPRPSYDLRNLYLLILALDGLESGDEYGGHYYPDANFLNQKRLVVLECRILLGELPPEASPIYHPPVPDKPEPVSVGAKPFLIESKADSGKRIRFPGMERMRLMGRFPTQISPVRKWIAILIMILSGLLLSRYISKRVNSDACHASGGVWNAATRKCEK